MLRSRSAFNITTAITVFTETGERSRSHGLRPDVVAAQVQRLGLTPLSGRATWAQYTDEYIRLLGEAAALGVTHVVFGDIMGEAHREWNERVCAAHGLTPVMPLWGEPTGALLSEFLATGSSATIVTTRTAHLDPSWLGRSLDDEASRELALLGVDACGEFGEYHTVVTNCPAFSSPLPVSHGVRVEQGPCWAMDVTC